MTFSDLGQWWNLVFVLPFLTALALLLLMTTGLLATEMDSDLDADTDIDMHGELDIGDAAHIDADVDHGDILTGDHDVAGDHDVGDGHGLAEALDFLGVGKSPLSIVLMSFCFVWGLSGVVATQVLKGILSNPYVFVWPAMGVALVCAVLFTHVISRIIGRVMPSGESYGVAPAQMVGKLATVRFRVTESSGTAQLSDSYGNFHEVPCRVKPGETEFTQGARVVLMEYDEARKVFLVGTDPLLEMGLEDNPAMQTRRSTPEGKSAVRNPAPGNKVEQ